MNRLIVTGASALFLVACSQPEESTTPAGNPPAKPAVQTDSKVVLELGKPV